MRRKITDLPALSLRLALIIDIEHARDIQGAV